MLFILVLKGTLGLAAVGEFDSEEACKTGLQQYTEILTLERTNEKHPLRLECYAVPKRIPEPKPREMWEL